MLDSIYNITQYYMFICKNSQTTFMPILKETINEVRYLAFVINTTKNSSILNVRNFANFRTYVFA